MNYTNGLDKKNFLEYVSKEFPDAYNNTHSMELLENVIDYCTTDNFTSSKNELFYTLKQLIPEITKNELLVFIDKTTITDEIYDECIHEYKHLDEVTKQHIIDYCENNKHLRPFEAVEKLEKPISDMDFQMEDDYEIE